MKTWNDMDWQSIEKEVTTVQQRIRRAVRAGRYREARKLQRQLTFNSRAARLLAVRHVTELSDGKYAPGVDGKLYTRPEEKLALANALDASAPPGVLLERTVEKSGGGTRTLTIPTLHDRAAQTLVKLALEPERKSSRRACTAIDRAGAPSRLWRLSVGTSITNRYGASIPTSGSFSTTSTTMRSLKRYARSKRSATSSGGG